jgi:hypothetical protein
MSSCPRRSIPERLRIRCGTAPLGTLVLNGVTTALLPVILSALQVSISVPPPRNILLACVTVC